jgi:DNA-binding response OmpR family regulator
MISGFDCSPSRATLFGADGILPKPFNTQILLNRVNELTSDFIES